MATRRDRTNQFGYVCPTENEAVWNADHPPQEKKPARTRVLQEDQIRRQGIQKTEARKQLDSFNEFLEGKKTDPELKKMRNVFITITHVCSLAGVRIDELALHFTDGTKVYRKEELSS